ncbi:MAG: McrC family protein [Bacteroidales bacterium]|nr:McrC family protein [Bacteroidales bacterium]
MNQNRVISISDNSFKQLTDGREISDIAKIADVTLRDLQASRSENLLIIPRDLDDCEDDIADSTICSLDRKDLLSTGNVMGFVGVGQTRMKIGSRFDRDTTEDHFLHYMLEKVYHLNLLDFQFTFDSHNIFDILLYLFPYYLDRAMSQGLYHQYRSYEHNDSRLTGPVDIARHIRKNIPFTGNIAYRSREYSVDNNLTELIRHTVEYIASKDTLDNILGRTEQDKENVSQIRMATPSYAKADRSRIIAKNLRFPIHPYYSEYIPLQRLCIQILLHEEIRYGQSTDEVYGMLFDGAWLWEEYVSTLLSPLHFKHPQNKQRRGGFSMFEHSRGAVRYPDYYLPGKIVLDAKYKTLQEKEISSFGRDDLNQIVTYMHVLSLKKGGFIFPGVMKVPTKNEGSLKGAGGKVYPLCLVIPQKCADYKTFCGEIKVSEQTLIRNILDIINE